MASSPSRFITPPQLRVFNVGERHATWLELFFDLCFVAAVAAVASYLHGSVNAGGIARAGGLFVIVWWAWMGYTWYASAFDTDDVVFRLGMLAAMLAVLGLAANVGRAAEGDSQGFVFGFVALEAILVGLFLRARQANPGERAFCTRYGAGFALAAALFLASLAFGDPDRYVVWAVALGVCLLTPIWAVRAATGDVYDAGHIPERYGLFTLIVLGEAVVVVAGSVSDTAWQWDSGLTAALGFVIAACIWWTYFGDEHAELLRRGMVSSFIWGYGHLLIFASIAAAGVGIELAIEASAEDHQLSTAARWLLCGSAAAYMAGITAIHIVSSRRVRDAVVTVRCVVIAVTLVVSFAAENLAPVWIVAILAGCAVAVTVFETLRQSEHDAEHAGEAALDPAGSA